MKKSKLFLSMLSLCFALAVLCFGVYAANQVNYEISGTISYVVSDCYIDMHTIVYAYDGDMPTTRSNLKNLADLFPDDTEYTSFASIASSNDLTQVGVSSYNSLSGTNQGVTIDDGDVLMEGLSLDLDSVENKAYVIVVNIKNLGDNDIYARLDQEYTHFYEKDGNDYSTTPMTNDEVAMSNLMRYQNGGKSVIQKDDVVNLVYVFGIEDVTLQIEDMKFDYALEINDGAYHPNDTVLNYDTTSHYYYVEMGEYDNNSIRWRLISIDGGLTKYEAPVYTSQQFDTASLPTGDCVFIQETNTSPQNSEIRTIDECNIYLNAVAFQANYGYAGSLDENDNVEEYDKFYAMEYDSDLEEYVYTTDLNGNYIKANDYSVSTIRQYINGTSVYKHVDWLDENYDSKSPREDKSTSSSNMLSDYNIDDENEIYTMIQKRSLKDMYKNMSDYLGEGEDPRSLTLPIANSLDSFWILSEEEASVLLGDGTTEWDDESICWIQCDDETGYYIDWWLRSPIFDNSINVRNVSGDGNYDFYETSSCYSVARAAFQLAI